MKIANSVLAVCVVVCGLVHGSTEKAKQLPSPYSEATLLPYNPHGWYQNHDGLAFLIEKTTPQAVIEVGSWMGLSTMDIAHMVSPTCKVYAVDTWEGSPNETHDPAILHSLYDQFLSNMIHAELTDKVVPIRQESIKAAHNIDVLADLIYLDATHTYEECYKDLCAWYPHLRPEGILCGDDFRWGDCGIERAVRQFAKENSLQVHENGWFWWLEPVVANTHSQKHKKRRR